VKIKIDENLPSRLVHDLHLLGHDADSVEDEGLAGRNDDVIWDAAQKEARFLITQDLDFSDARKYTPGLHHGLMLIRLHVPGKVALTQKVISLFQNEPTHEWTGCIVVATDQKIRVRRPPAG